MKLVSLGSRCQIANQLKHFSLRNESFPFDWMSTDNPWSVQAILKGGKGTKSGKGTGPFQKYKP
jgi:hypothetical protein